MLRVAEDGLRLCIALLDPLSAIFKPSRPPTPPPIEDASNFFTGAFAFWGHGFSLLFCVRAWLTSYAQQWSLFLGKPHSV
jgi:hypothetical protein